MLCGESLLGQLASHRKEALQESTHYTYSPHTHTLYLWPPFLRPETGNLVGIKQPLALARIRSSPLSISRRYTDMLETSTSFISSFTGGPGGLVVLTCGHHISTTSRKAHTMTSVISKKKTLAVIMIVRLPLSIIFFFRRSHLWFEWPSHTKRSFFYYYPSIFCCVWLNTHTQEKREKKEMDNRIKESGTGSKALPPFK
jgi:hypothetical protein